MSSRRDAPPAGAGKGRIVYSTDKGSLCPVCGWPERQCACSSRIGAGDEAVPTKITAKLRIEKQGRSGKTVTVIDALPNNQAFLRDLAAELKRACGTGGSAGEGSIELQGDRRERLRTLLAKKGYLVKG
jgi:translation initiation factor 1